MTTKETKSIILDEEEQMWEDLLLSDQLKTPDNIEELKRDLAASARQTIEMRETKPVSIRVNKVNLEKLKVRASHEGIPYQTLINSLIHRYVREEPQTKYSTSP